MLRSGSLSISALVVLALWLAALSFAVPRIAHSQSTIPGVVCQQIGGTYVCTQQGTGGQVCINNDDAGTQSCLNLINGGTSSGGSTSLGTGLGHTNQPPSSSASSGWLSQLTHWYAIGINVAFDAIVAFLKDLVTYLVKVICDLVLAAISAVGSPGWLSSYSLGSLLGNVGIGYFMLIFQVPAGLTLIGGGYVFRLVRKFLTLFQW